jgi:hypothetical protein
MCIGVQRKPLPDWWDRVIELMNAEVFDGQMTAKQIEGATRVLREMVKLEDIFLEDLHEA